MELSEVTITIGLSSYIMSIGSKISRFMHMFDLFVVSLPYMGKGRVHARGAGAG
jgi:hypothetical protein